MPTTSKMLTKRCWRKRLSIISAISSSSSVRTFCSSITAYLGQLNGYLTVLDDFVRKPHENPAIGLVLCKSADKSIVEYLIKDYNKPMGVATYRTKDEMPEKFRRALPDIEDLKKLL